MRKGDPRLWLVAGGLAAVLLVGYLVSPSERVLEGRRPQWIVAAVSDASPPETLWFYNERITSLGRGRYRVWARGRGVASPWPAAQGPSQTLLEVDCRGKKFRLGDGGVAPPDSATWMEAAPGTIADGMLSTACRALAS